MDTLTTAIGTEALKIWGAYAIILLLFGWRLWSQHTEIAELRRRNQELQDRRLEDAKQLIRVTEASSATAASRVQGDQQFREIMTTMASKLSSISEAQDVLERNHAMLEHLVTTLPASAAAPRLPKPRRGRP